MAKRRPFDARGYPALSESATDSLSVYLPEEVESAIGAWPWTDVYMSNETDNLLLSDLSAGPVGTGDVLGKEDRRNILKAVRGDGVIVKPDAPIMPLDRMYIADATHRNTPFIADTWTDDGPVRTAYVFAFSRSQNAGQTVRFTAHEVGINGPTCVFDYFRHKVQRLSRGATFTSRLAAGASAYYIVAPVERNGIALFGDSGQFVSMGKQRISSLNEGARSLAVQVLFAPDEHTVTVAGAAPSRPAVTVRDGHAGPVHFAKSSGYFSLRVSPETSAAPAKVDGNPVRRVTVKITRG